MVEGFTFRNGPTGTELDQFGGGALALIQANVTVRNCVFTANRSALGGAIYGAISASTIENCTFTGNTASAAGGAICFEQGSGWVVRNCTFSGNTTAGSGGAIHSRSSGGLVELCTVTGNTAALMGGAVSWESLASEPVSISGCVFETNAAAAGGALAVTSGTGAFGVSNSRICRNTPSNFAGGVTDLGGNTFSTDGNATGVCAADEISSGGALDCNGNGVIDWCDISSGTALDCNLNGIPDACDISSGAAPDCNLNGVPDGCDLSAGTSLDCNANGIPDSCDIAGGVSNDVDSNGIPDECKPDCDGDGLPDAWELSQGLEPDCNANGVIDRCDTAGNPASDCDQDTVPDSCELAADPSLDCNGNGRLDGCDIASDASLDCNGNGRIDSCDLSGTPGLDCDGNGAIDTCEIAGNAGFVKNGNGWLDTCELARGDLNLDGVVNAADLALLLNFWGFVNPPVGDLNGDGAWEIVWAGPTSTMIIDGASGDILTEYAGANTTCSGPVPIVDLDGDGHAEIVVVTAGGKITALRDTRGFTKARGVWHQSDYSLTNTEDSSQMPDDPEPNWLGENNFRAGGSVDIIPSLYPVIRDVCSDECAAGTAWVWYSVANNGYYSVTDHLSMEFWGVSGTSVTKLASSTWTGSVDSGMMTESYFIELTGVPTPLDDIQVRITGVADAVYEDCDESDDIAFWTAPVCP